MFLGDAYGAQAHLHAICVFICHLKRQVHFQLVGDVGSREGEREAVPLGLAARASDVVERVVAFDAVAERCLHGACVGVVVRVQQHMHGEVFDAAPLAEAVDTEVILIAAESSRAGVLAEPMTKHVALDGACIAHGDHGVTHHPDGRRRVRPIVVAELRACCVDVDPRGRCRPDLVGLDGVYGDGVGASRSSLNNDAVEPRYDGAIRDLDVESLPHDRRARDRRHGRVACNAGANLDGVADDCR